ncbi:jg24468 [Pararge aegeria aegeria]|uniref:Jg24468 protein n=1 Tax=Pararge aegeria aegeria TaxID=348720 RepID=A0A8S4QCI0_9NEOP|nr:jg24468 [Pararge aegeria aegeria]
MSLSTLNKIIIPRHVIGLEPLSIELHIFSDASQVAYGACAYVRTVSNDNTITNRLLCAKAKVAPVKPLTIPRLELSGAVLSARLFKKISDSLRCKFNKVVFWTDSTIVLGWLQMAPNLLKTFVQNRVVEILELTGELPWRHVSGKDNPADMASRGVLLNDLATSKLWWNGPQFLHDPIFNDTIISSETKNILTCEELPEVKSSSVFIITQDRELFPFPRFSHFRRMRRTFAYVLRFIHNARNYKINRQDGALSLDELRKAELGLAKLSQAESYGEEYILIKNNNTKNLKSSLLKLNLFIDEKCDLIRVGGRIANSTEFEYNKMHPILLSSKHRFTILLLRHEHTRLLHVPSQALLYEVRQKWWPIGGRNLARQVTHECVLCKRLKGNTLHPLMGNLPKERITPSYPFLYCGVDYAGPIRTLNRKGRGARTVKSYICLFICFVTRAVHLELVSDLASESYILALKRFISRRAKPTEIFSDNGKNFIGAMNEFGKFLKNCSIDISEYAISQDIKFRFIPAYSPHFGGLWEAGVKSTKYHLTRVIGNAHLTFEELTTVLTQVESILNFRPLSLISSDPRDFLPLTPAYFLVGRSLTAPVYEDMRHNTGTSLSRYKRLEQIRHHFWERWSKEYISELQTRCKWMSGVDTLQPGMMVIIKDDNLPPLRWQLGRITNAVPGKDGISRVADIRTATGVVRRSFAKICPLFFEDETTKTMKIT